MAKLPKLLIVKVGVINPAIAAEARDYEQWFVDTMGDKDRFTISSVVTGEKLPRLAQFDGTIVTGSPLSLCAPEPWMESVAGALVEHSAKGGAVLGVCFGHQLLSHASGARIVQNPNGREIGTIEIELNDAGVSDPLFAGVPRRFAVQATHTDIPERVVGELLASNANSPSQAASFGPRSRGVQFHPEMPVETIRAIISLRQEAMRAEGLDPARISSAVRECSAGAQILRNFERRFVMQS